jgi:RNA-directed DNA polymerase
MARTNLKTHNDVATLLEVSPAYLKFVLRAAPRYKLFHIPKKTGGLRQIAAPTGPILQLQKKLLPYFETLYGGRISAHGFIKGKSIYSNAEPHAKSRFVFNIDLENFFPSIHFGRVRGLLMGKPYYMG